MTLLVCMTGEQLRAARAMLRLEQADLAKRCGLSLETVKRLERIRGRVDANVRTLRAIVDVFQRLGLVFESSDCGAVGIRLVSPAGAPGAQGSGPSHWSERRGQALHRLIYFSTAIPMPEPEMEWALRDIARTSAPISAALEVTGVLIACGGFFLQALEGRREAVLQVYGAVSTDPRHRELRILESAPIASRRFADWTVCARPLRPGDPVFAGEPAMAGGFDPQRLSSSAALDLLGAVATAVARILLAQDGAGSAESARMRSGAPAYSASPVRLRSNSRRPGG